MAPRRKAPSASERDQREPDQDETAQDESAQDEPAGQDESAQDESSADGQGRDGPALTATQAAKAALRQIFELTAKQPESITGVQRREDGWSVCFEVVEDRRIPSSADILATYETTIDSGGELMSYRRLKRYSRGRGNGS